MDTVVPGVALGQILGRWGNFFNREAFGEYTNNILAMRIPMDAVRYSDVTELMRENMETIEGEWGQAENKIIIRSDYPNDDDIILTYDNSQKTLTSEIVGGDYDIVWKKQ